MTITIAVVGDFDARLQSHVATNAALALYGAGVEASWVPTTECNARVLEGFDGIWAAPGSPYESLEGALHAIRFAREAGKPFLAT